MIENLIKIIKKADDIILDVYNQDYDVNYKQDNSPVTKADLAASDYICQELISLYPDIPLICEETADITHNVRKKWNKFWLIDPLDGTKEFIKKNGEFTVNIALIEDNRPIFGIVSIPCQGLIYYASNGNGAYVLDKNDDSQKQLTCEPFNDEVIFSCSRSHINQETEEFMKKYNVKDIIRSGSSLKFMLICENKAHIYPRLYPTMEWDIAASDIILQEAGGSIKLLDDSLMTYNKENLTNPSFVAYGHQE